MSGALDDRTSWFYELRSTSSPWHTWLVVSGLPPKGFHPLEAWLEREIVDLCQLADRRRLAVEPKTDRFATMWATFRRHHEELDERGKHRRARFMIWRAAALKTICDRNRFQDDIDRQMARDKLVEAYQFFGFGSAYPRGLWHVPIIDFDDGTKGPSPLHEYAAMVLLLFGAVVL
jgi:hypothetical protein